LGVHNRTSDPSFFVNGGSAAQPCANCRVQFQAAPELEIYPNAPRLWGSSPLRPFSYLPKVLFMKLMNRSPVASHLRVEVKHRCAAPKRYTWEIFSEGKALSVDESPDQFRSWEEASQAGKKALKKLLARPVARPSSR
jgi:hypothetical protein